MKHTALLFSALALASAANAGDFVTRAKVIGAAPVVETIYESGHCRKQRTRGNTGNTGDKIIGGLLGGAAGSALGKGSGKDAATAAGVLLGSEIADNDGQLGEGELIGALVGGVVGNQVGKGKGKTAATGAGTLLGAIVGDNLQHGQPSARRTANRCKQTAKKVITGYEITYEYGGVRQTGTLPYQPGEYVDIHVGVSLLENRTVRADG